MQNNLVDEVSVEKYIQDRISEFKGLTITQLKEKFKINSTSKSLNSMLISRIVSLENIDIESLLFLKKHYVFKTVKVTAKNKVTESMSFPAIDYYDMLKHDWNNSNTYKYFSEKTFLLFIFKESENDSILIDFITLKFSKLDLSEIFLVWEKVKNMLINNTLIIGGKFGYSVENFPKKNENGLIHVRPHDNDSKVGKILLPDGRKIINYCFWLNNTFIENKINNGGILYEKVR